MTPTVARSCDLGATCGPNDLADRSINVELRELLACSSFPYAYRPVMAAAGEAFTVWSPGH